VLYYDFVLHSGDWLWGPHSLLSNGYWWFFPLGVKWLVCEADHSPPSNAEVKYEQSYTSTAPYAFMAWCSVKNKA